MRGFIVPQVFPTRACGQQPGRLSVYCSRMAGVTAADRVAGAAAAERRLAGAAGGAGALPCLVASAGGSLWDVGSGSGPVIVRKMPAASGESSRFETNVGSNGSVTGA